jgi:hypothetical protein
MWGQDEEFQTPLLAGGFELGGELAAAVDLHQQAQGSAHPVISVRPNGAPIHN